VLPDDLPPHHKSGFIAVVGKPNVGKSTLINAFLGQKIAPVSAKPQTTRSRQLGILTQPDSQTIFIDTPGVHAPHHKLGELMNRAAERALADADMILFVVDLSTAPDGEDRHLAELIRRRIGEAKVILALNKLDLVRQETLSGFLAAYQALVEEAIPFAISAKRGDGRDGLLAALLDALPPGPRYYPAEDVTDTYVRDIAGELVREAALDNLREEVPHGIAVRIDEFKERAGGGVYVQATVFVEKENHKGIVIGRQGQMLKAIGQQARAEIEALTGGKAYLELRVKVDKDWRDDARALRRFGYREQR